MERAQKPGLGVVLAAGIGSRLSTRTGEKQMKPLLPVAGRPLILRTIDGLSRAGCERVVIVTGHESEELRTAVEQGYRGPASLSFCHNPDYTLQNGVSVLAARSAIDAAFILTMSDHVLSPSVMALAGAHRPPADGATLLVDRKVDSVFDLDDATKVLARDNRIIFIGKTIADYNCIDTGVFVCTPALLDAIQRVFESKGDASLSDGVQALAARGRMEALDIGDGQWQDVDTPEMLEEAERLVAAWRK
jgi:1L-myo-inositol 1-phosphate cytidylyltransferase